MTHPPEPTAVDVASDTLPPAPPRPAAGTPSAYRFPHFATRILANGLRLIVANVPAYPVVTTLGNRSGGHPRSSGLRRTGPTHHAGAGGRNA